MRNLGRGIAALLALALVSLASPALGQLDPPPPIPVSLSPGLAADAESLPGSTPYMAFVHFANGGTPDEWTSHVAAAGLTAGFVYERFKAVLVSGTLDQVLSLRSSNFATHLEKDELLEWQLESSQWAANLGPVRGLAGSGPYTASTGLALDGSGVGVAVVDSGIDQTHPDFAGRIDAAYEATCSLVLETTATGRCFPDPTLVPQPVPTDNTAGHGTHVAGIALGAANASGGTFKGMAPAATLTSFSVGEGPSAAFASVALEYLADKLAENDPAFEHIKVVNNSYGNTGGTAYNPNGIIEVAAREIVAQGVTMVFAAGNSAGNGTADAISSYGKDPTPGVISVANYDDAGFGSLTEGGGRNNTLSSSSSRGRQAAGPGGATTSPWPDVSAPGGFITAPCVLRPTECANPAFGIPSEQWAPYYANLGGTSMAAPHVAGIVALLYQANPGITPADVEDILKDTAYKFTGLAAAPGPYVADPRNDGGTTSFDKGAGLVDATAALMRAGAVAPAAPADSKPSISITSPKAGDRLKGTVTVTGRVHDGFDAAAPVTLATDAVADSLGSGATDITGVQIAQRPDGVEWAIGLADATDLGLLGEGAISVQQNIDGRQFLTRIDLAAGASPVSSTFTTTAPATNVRLDGDTLRFLVPWSSLGNPALGTVVHNIRVFSPNPLVHQPLSRGPAFDVAPGGSGPTLLTNAVFAEAYAVAPAEVAPSSVGVDVTIAGVTVPATISGSSPNFTYSTQLDVQSLDAGEYPLTATLSLAGKPAATATVPVLVKKTDPKPVALPL